MRGGPKHRLFESVPLADSNATPKQHQNMKASMKPIFGHLSVKSEATLVYSQSGWVLDMCLVYRGGHQFLRSLDNAAGGSMRRHALFGWIDEDHPSKRLSKDRRRWKVAVA